MPRFSIDLSPELNTWLEERAKAEGRSKAKQVAYILKLFKDTIGDHSAGLLRPPGYSLQDEQWLALKGGKWTEKTRTDGEGRMKILITGGFGFLGQHLTAKLKALGHTGYPVSSKSYDLRSQAHIDALFNHFGAPDLIYHLAAHVGGIAYNLANPATIYCDNVLMNTLLIDKAAKVGVKKFVFVSSTCAYPAFPSLPTSEDELWDGYPEESNGTYGISKRIVLPQLQAYKQQYGMGFAYPVLANLYGPGDDFSEGKSHVVAALIRKFCAGPETVEIWGDGSPTRDLLYVEDAAEALCCFLDQDYEEPVNIASGEEISIKQLVYMLQYLTSYKGTLLWQYDKPMGQMRRWYDLRRAEREIGWQPRTGIEEGLRETVNWYRGQR